MSALASAVRSPVITLPVDGVSGNFSVHTFPPDIAVIGQADVREDDVLLDGFHGDRVGLVRRARSYAEVAVFRIDGVECAVFMRPDPSDVVTDDRGFPTGFTIGSGGNKHGKVGFAAGRRESTADINFFTRGGFDAQEQHVFGHPLVLTSNGRSDAESKALLAEQSVAAVTGTEGPDFLGFREVADVFFFVAGPGNVNFTGFQRGTDCVEAGNERTVAVALRVAAALGFVFEALENFSANLGHNAHVHDNVGAVGDFDADFGEGGIKRAHAEGDDVHGTTLHAAFEEAAESFLHLDGVCPVVGRAGVFFLFGADECPIFDASNVGRGGTSQEAAGAFFLIQFDKCALLDHHFAKFIIFFLRTVAPIDGVGRTKLGDFFDPLLSSFVSGTSQFHGKPRINLFFGFGKLALLTYCGIIPGSYVVRCVLSCSRRARDGCRSFSSGTDSGNRLVFPV